MADTNVDLVSVFSAVSKALRQNKETINQADSYNHDHGTNMAQTFATITKVMKANQDQGQGQALAQAAQVLSQQATSSSGKLYAQGLQQAAQQIQGDRVDPQMAIQVLQSLLGGGQSGGTATSGSQAPGGQLGNLLGSLLGSQSSQTTQGSQPAAGGDLLGSLLSGFGQSQPAQQSGGLQDGLDLGDLVTAGKAFLQSKQSGANTINSLVAAFTAASGMGNAPYRQQSTQIVANSFLQALQKFK